MVFQIFLNSLIALLWQFLQADFTFSTFFNRLYHRYHHVIHYASLFQRLLLP